MNANEYLNLITDLNQCLMRDATILLALTVAWLDPLAVLEDLNELQNDDLSDYYYSGDDMGAALSVSRDCFPGIYAEAISKIRDGDSYQTVASFVGDTITDQTGLPVNEYEEPGAYAYGIPLPYYGFDLGEADFDENYPGVSHLLRIFGAQTDDMSAFYSSFDLPCDIWELANMLQWSLWPTRDNPLHKDIMWAVAYCFSNSGNSSVDYSFEIACEFEPLSWTADDVEFASAIAREAEEIMNHALTGLEIIRADSHIQTILKKKIAEAEKQLKQLKQKGKKLDDCISRENPNPFNIRWDDLCLSTDRDPATDPELLQLRVDVA